MKQSKTHGMYRARRKTKGRKIKGTEMRQKLEAFNLLPRRFLVVLIS
jgi:hypothetical protein